MKRKMFITIPIIVVLVGCMISSFILISKKPDTSNVNQALKIAEYTKPSVVRIINYSIVNWTLDQNYVSDKVINYFNKIQSRTIIGGSGSGAIISSDGYVVTNAHVVELSKLTDQEVANQAFEQLCQGMAAEFGYSTDVISNFLVKYVVYTKIETHIKVIVPSDEASNGNNILDGEIKSYGAPVGEGKDVSVLKVEGKNFPVLNLGDSSTVKLQDNIWVFGFPGAADSSLLSPDSSLVVSITDGKVSAVDKKSTQGAPVLQVSASATHGNSGGPVTDQNGKIVGLLTFRGDSVNGQEVQGFNFAVPSNTVKEFVAQSGAKNEQSEVDTLYQSGLELYWGGYYKDALSKFEGVQRLNSGFLGIKNLISECQQKSSSSKILWSSYKTSFITFDAVSAAAIILLLVFTFVVKPKKSRKVVEVSSDNINPQQGNSLNESNHMNTNPQQENTLNIEGLTDLNHDGKIDIQDVILAVQKQNDSQKQSENNNNKD